MLFYILYFFSSIVYIYYCIFLSRLYFKRGGGSWLSERALPFNSGQTGFISLGSGFLVYWNRIHFLTP